MSSQRATIERTVCHQSDRVANLYPSTLRVLPVPYALLKNGTGQQQRIQSMEIAMVRRRFKTEADIARFVKQGFGQGEGSAYVPWIRVQDVPSRGRSRKVPGIKSGRIHHTLSDLEYYYLLLLEFSSNVIDIREQYPIFATARTRDIAAQMGIRYPMYVGTQLPFVMTSDYAVTLSDSSGKRRTAIRTCKYEGELSDPNNGLAVLEKLELERAIWADQGVTDWMVVTDQLMSQILKENLDWLHKSAFSNDAIATEEQRAKYTDAVVRAADGSRPLSAIVRSISSAVGIPYRNGMALFKQLVWDKVILTDLENVRLDPTLPCPRLDVRGISANKEAA